MSKNKEGLYKNVTLTDVQLAAAYYPILIGLAKHKHCMTYGELVDKAKAEYPERPEVQNAIAVSAGRRLDIVRLFTDERELPDLTSLIINKGSGECGSGYTQHYNPVQAREEVYARDWSNVSTEFDLYIEGVQQQITPRKKRSKKAAKDLMFTYYREHKATLPKSVQDSRELIIELLMEGFSQEDAFAQAVTP
ncbi:hypothetical protein [Microbulbifer magnicolonia]|uniref:hypothetical protein n=1 Tax=Microbulbifer magnicolonia TaxID=3109744 RepID=UPI002B40BE02|nr:hypothetical protein [Microbulbifer sp. GG15]